VSRRGVAHSREIMYSGYQPRLLYFVSRPQRLAYLQVPKVACSSFRVAMALLNRPELSLEQVTERGAIHRNTDWNEILTPESEELPEYFRFTFVRDPIARFVSFYRSKIARADGEPTRDRFRKLGYDATMSIEAVLERVENTPPAELDDHIVPQSALLMRNGRLLVDFIGRLERMDEDLKLVEARAGTSLRLVHMNPTSNVRREDTLAQLSAETRQRLERFYTDDLQLLGYGR
jgi:hypothetical protein